MPNLSGEPSADPDRLRRYLVEFLPTARLTNAVVDPAYQPLMLLQTQHLMAAFAFSNGDAGKSYEALYGSFKKYYAEQRGQWDALDLSFVFCVRPNLPNLDRFCSTIETDVYFCRKFVVTLRPPIEASLSRLPFLPLTPLHGHSLRPASAQTFLQQCSVPAALARCLVSQHQRSAEGIVEDCTSGLFGDPRPLTSGPGAPIVDAEGAVRPIRLESVVISNFRAYRRPQTFALGPDVTVLYGPNGFGKTSFFDAIEFAATGGIGRIKSSNDAHFKKAANHLDSNSEEGVVSLSFSSNGLVRKVTRRVGARKQAVLDGRSTDRKTLLSELTGGESPAADRVDNFVSLFRATHLFSQEEQELAREFRDDCRLPEPVVSRMLAFEDYSNAVNKAAKVREVLQTAIQGASVEIRELSEEIADDQSELARLGRGADGQGDIPALDAEIASLRARLLEAGIPATPGTPDAAVVRGWRASLEGRLAESQGQIARLADLAREAADLPRKRAELRELQGQIAKKEQAVVATDGRRSVAELGLQRAEQRLAEVSVARAQAQTRADLLEWIRTTQPRYTQLLDEHKSLTEDLNRATSALAQHRASADSAGRALRTHETLAAQATAKLAAARAQLLTAQHLIDTNPAWQANRARRAARVEVEEAAMKSLEELRAQERELSQHAAGLAAKEAALSDQITEVDRNQSEFKKLLSQLQGHVRDGICPLCGEDHGSMDELVRRIQTHMTRDAATATRGQLTEVQEKARHLAKQFAESKGKQQAIATRLAALVDENARLTTDIASFAGSAKALGVDLGAPEADIAEQFHSVRCSAEREVEKQNAQVLSEEAELEAERSAMQDAKALVATATVEIPERRASLARLQDEANGLRNDPRLTLTELSLDVDSEKLADLQRLTLLDISAFNAEAAKAEADAVEQRPQVSALAQESASTKAGAGALRATLATLQKGITQVTARLSESGFPPDSSEDSVLAMMAEESRVQARLVALRDSVSSLELALDAATTAAALTRMNQSVHNKERALAAAMRKRDQHAPWLNYFEELSHLVSSSQSEAIAGFTREYGPRTSVIQQRLRSVYGFDNIEIQSHGSTISVRVKRHGEDLRPTDYFSQSQQQTLLLGLFLTACISQTWSAFCPVFLDDPVTHFDDLNTYAFLDLIVGLIESEPEKRQFIISTCDEKLLQLARRKFRHLSERATFYRFSAIGAEGPVVDEIRHPSAAHGTQTGT